MFGVNDSDDAVQLEFVFDPLVNEKGLDDGRRIGKPGGFDHQRVELGLVFEELKQAAEQVAAHGAADAAVAHFNDFLIGANKQVVVDSDFAKLIDNDSHAPAMVGGQNAIEKRSLTCAEKTCEDCYGYALIAAFHHVLEFLPEVFSKGNNEPWFSQLEGTNNAGMVLH